MTDSHIQKIAWQQCQKVNVTYYIKLAIQINTHKLLIELDLLKHTAGKSQKAHSNNKINTAETQQ